MEYVRLGYSGLKSSASRKRGQHRPECRPDPCRSVLADSAEPDQFHHQFGIMPYYGMPIGTELEPVAFGRPADCPPPGRRECVRHYKVLMQGRLPFDLPSSTRSVGRAEATCRSTLPTPCSGSATGLASAASAIYVDLGSCRRP